MTKEGIIRMSQKELRRLHIIRKTIDRLITQKEATLTIGLSRRQVCRILKRIKEEGDEGIIHKSRGRRSNRRIPEQTRDKVIDVYRHKYSGFGPTLATEKLLEEERIQISEETLRKWLIAEGIEYPRRKKRPHRQWRQRKSHIGQMLQMDGSCHDWFEGRGSKCVFMGYIDDATGRVFGRFYEYEGTIPAMKSFKLYIENYGIPLSVYADKHSTYKSTKKRTPEDELNDIKPMSEFERALEELGVEVIHANSPQAKGRVERLFGTLQDRLVKEMRLKGIKSIQEANEFLEKYLPVYNKRFSIAPAKNEDMHMPLSKELDLDSILCIKKKRTLRNDFTIAYNNKLYQIKDNIRTKKVTIEQRLDGSLFITHRGNQLTYKQISQRPAKKEVNKDYGITRKVYRPPADHPWKRFPIKPHIVKSQLKKEEPFIAKI